MSSSRERLDDETGKRRNGEGVKKHLCSISRFARVRQIRGSTDEATAAYIVTYVRIAEEGVRSPSGSRERSRDR